MSNKANEYEVGYGKPPKKYQFKPGYSGNKKGRPKGSLNVFTVLEKMAKEKVKIAVNGKSKKVSIMEAALRKLLFEALQGDTKSLKVLLTLFLKNDARRDELSQRMDGLSQDDMNLLAENITRYVQGEQIYDKNERNSAV